MERLTQKTGEGEQITGNYAGEEANQYKAEYKPSNLTVNFRDLSI